MISIVGYGCDEKRALLSLKSVDLASVQGDTAGVLTSFLTKFPVRTGQTPKRCPRLQDRLAQYNTCSSRVACSYLAKYE